MALPCSFVMRGDDVGIDMSSVRLNRAAHYSYIPNIKKSLVI